MNMASRTRSAVPYILLVPAFTVFLLFFILPFLTLILNSFYDYSRLAGIQKTFTLKNYMTVWLDPYYLRIVGRTLRLAALTALVTVLIGYPVALYLGMATARARALIIFFVLSPLMVSVVIRTFGWLIILGPNGLVDNVIQSFGLPSASFLHTEFAVVLGLANVLLPFVVLSIATALQAIDPAVPLAAASLGARPSRVFLSVILPLSLPGVLAGLLIVFSLASSSFVTPAILGGAQFRVLSTVMYQQALVLQNWPFAASIAVALVLIVLIVLTLQTRIIERGRYKVVFQ